MASLNIPQQKTAGPTDFQHRGFASFCSVIYGVAALCEKLHFVHKKFGLLAASDIIEYSIDMTFFLALIGGNVSAWLVHCAAWWLRLHSLKWIGVFGFLCGAPLASLSLMALLSGWFVWQWMWLLLLGIGWLQSRWIEEETAPMFFAVWALFAEALLAFFLYAVLMTFVAPVSIRQFEDIYFWTFLATLLLLAVFRPLVVRYSQRFRNLIRPEHTKPTI